MAFPNVSNRSDQTFYTGPAGNGTAITTPMTVVNGDTGATGAIVAAAVATDSATTLALANNLRAGLIALGLFSAA